MCENIENHFQELYSTDVNKYVEKKKSGGTELSYLTWSYAWAEFKKVYPDATYTISKDEQGRCYFGDENIGYMTYTSVTADGLTYEMWLPVMDGANKAMKFKPYTYTTRNGEKTVEGISMFDINKTLMRCLVKNLAMFGLGLYIYSGEDLPEQPEQKVKTPQEIDKLRQEIQEKAVEYVGDNSEKLVKLFQAFCKVDNVVSVPDNALEPILIQLNSALEKRHKNG